MKKCIAMIYETGTTCQDEIQSKQKPFSVWVLRQSPVILRNVKSIGSG